MLMIEKSRIIRHTVYVLHALPKCDTLQPFCFVNVYHSSTNAECVRRIFVANDDYCRIRELFAIVNVTMFSYVFRRTHLKCMCMGRTLNEIVREIMWVEQCFAQALFYLFRGATKQKHPQNAA